MDSGEILVLGLKLLLVVFLVLLNGFFVAAEFAIVKIRDTQLVGLVAAGNRRARMARLLISRLDASLSATQLGITLASLGLGWVGEPVFAALLAPAMEWFNVESEKLRHTIAFVVGFSAITFLHIVAGELAPKSLAIQKPLPTTLWVAYPLRWFYLLSYPFNWALNGTSLWLLRRLGLEAVTEAELVHSEEELRLLFTANQKQRSGKARGRDIVLNALDLRHRVARDVMRPRHEIAALSTETSLTECLDLAEKTRFSRFPLCECGDLDRTLGVVHLKDLFAQRHKARSGADLAPLARKLIYVPETARLEGLLDRLLDRRLHMAIVVDEFGGTVGLVTLENILEELVGQIQDEFDQEKPLLVQTGEHTWEALGALPVHELAELLGERLDDEGAATTSGWVTRRLGGFPKEGDALAVGRSELRVEEMAGTRVARLSVRRPPAPSREGEETPRT
jgi:CBS domain containing-hemolysin-like protein